MLFATEKNALVVDTFLLSCRVLGRGVEHQMLSYLGTLAQERRLERVELFYTLTQKNQPAKDFLTSVGRQFQQEKDSGWLFQFPSQTASKISFSPISDTNTVVNQEAKSPQSLRVCAPLREINLASDFFEHIAHNLYSPELILKEITSRQQRQRSQLDIEFVAPRTLIEKAIAQLFAEVLKLDTVGINDNFFELDGDSIRGAILINKL